MWYGQTDKLFERLRWHITTYGKVLILVDEAHTAFGSVHRSSTHETERRLLLRCQGSRRQKGQGDECAERERFQHENRASNAEA